MSISDEQGQAIRNEFKRFAGDMNLSDEQKTKLHERLAFAAGRLFEYKKSHPEVTRQDIIKAVGSHRAELREGLERFLSPEQLMKWDAEVAKAKEFLGHAAAWAGNDRNEKWLARSFRAGYWIENLGWSPHGREAPITRKGLIMLDKKFEEEQALGVDERLARVARIIVEQYDGDVKAFVESIRSRIEVNRKAEAASDDGDEAAFRKCPSTTKIIGRISRAHCSWREK
jgi:protein CpxP